MKTPNIKMSNAGTFPNSYSAPAMESPDAMLHPKAPMGSSDGERVTGMPHGRIADDAQMRKPFADMAGEKVPMMGDNDQEVDSDDLAPMANTVEDAGVVGDHELSQSSGMDGSSNVPPGGREQGSSVHVSKMSQSFENGRSYSGGTHAGNVLQGDSNQIEITTYE